MAVRRKTTIVEEPQKLTTPVSRIFTFGNSLLLAAVVLLALVAFMLGALWQKIENLEKKGATNVVAQQGQQAAPVPAKKSPLEAQKVSDVGISEVTNKDHVQGAESAKVTWIEYSDLECPFCKKIHPDVQKLMSDYSGQIRWVYRHFPLTSLHPNAQKAAEASECAAELAGPKAFWTFTDNVFAAAVHDVTPDALEKIATGMGINLTAFKSCVDSGKYADRVKEDVTTGSTAGVTGTPKNFVLDGNGNVYVIDGALPYATLKQVVDKALGK